MYRWPDQEEECAHKDGGESRDDRHKAGTTKETQNGWQLNVVEAVVQHHGHPTDHQGANDTCVNGWSIGTENLQERFDACHHDQIAHHAGKCCGSLVALSQADAQADGEKDGQVFKNRRPGRRHDSENSLQYGVIQDGVGRDCGGVG